MDMQSILYQVDEGVATITLNRPDKLNAFTADMLGEFRTAIEVAGADENVRAVLVTGAGRAFSAGQDLGDRDFAKSNETPDLSATLASGYHPLIRAITALEKPSVCAVNGVAAGAGANIALHFDIVIAARSAKFIQAFSKIGLIPDSGGTYWLPRLVGPARARALAMLAVPLAADQAAKWGLIWKAVDDNVLLLEARNIARHLATQPTLGLALTKKLMAASFDNDLEAQLAMEAECQKIGGQSEDYKEGVTAFLEKRAPEFKGR